MIIKFFMGESYNAMSCDHYHVTKIESGVVEVTLYPTYKSADGVTYRVAGFESRCELPHFGSCVVMNNDGDTVEVIYGSSSELIKNHGGTNE